MDYVCCTTGYSAFDVWALVHSAFWVFVGSCLWALKIDKVKATIACLLVALAWEAFEGLVAFRLWPRLWLDPESWWNSWLSDPLTCLIGVISIYWILENRPRRMPWSE